MAGSYSHISLLRTMFEYEMMNTIKFRSDLPDGVADYFKKRIQELKEEEKECLKIQTSLKK